MNKKKLSILLCGLLMCFSSFSQTDRIGLFKNLKVKTGFTATGFYNFSGEYKYILQQDASVKEISVNQVGASLSIVVLFPLDTFEKHNLLFNISFLDFKSDANLFNSQTPFGIGYAYFFNKLPVGITGMINFGRQKRMYDFGPTIYFPIDHYKNSNGVSALNVGAPVPEAILEPYLRTITTVSINTGIIIRL